jgi:hypothetical protein
VMAVTAGKNVSRELGTNFFNTAGGGGGQLADILLVPKCCSITAPGGRDGAAIWESLVHGSLAQPLVTLICPSIPYPASVP